LVKRKSQIEFWLPRKAVVSRNYKCFSIEVGVGVGDVDVGLSYRKRASLLDGIPEEWDTNVGIGK
jgi:hypothetical protein